MQTFHSPPHHPFSLQLWHFAFRFHLSNSSVEEKRAHALKVLAVSRNIEAMFDDAKAAVAADTGMAFYERLGARAYDWQARSVPIHRVSTSLIAHPGLR